MDIEEWTNDPGLWSDLKGQYYNVALWVVWDSSDRLTLTDILNKQSFNEAILIFIIDKEGLCYEWVHADERIHVWDSVVYDHPRFHSYFWWWEITQIVANETQSVLKLNSPNNPSYIFECLTGSNTTERDVIDNRIVNSKFKNLIMYNYYGKTGKWMPTSNYDIFDNGLNPASGTLFKYNSAGQEANVSTIIPVKIYNDSWFSIVAEKIHELTNKQFLSEKTAKPLLGKRMFVLFAKQYALQDLRKIGFKTFSDVIDESYDNIEDDTQRWHAAFDQVEYICQQDPILIYNSIRKDLDHNQELFLSLSRDEKLLKEMQTVINTLDNGFRRD